MINALIAAVLAFAALGPSSGDACGIVYGNDWGIIFQAPPGWTSACGNDAMQETVLTLWPSDQSPGTAQALIYVTVSGKEHNNLTSFVDDEIARFKADAPGPGKPAIEPQPDTSPTRKLVHVANATGGRDELVEYIEGPTAFYIVVLTAESPAATVRYKAAYQAFLDSFSPTSVTHSGG